MGWPGGPFNQWHMEIIVVVIVVIVVIVRVGTCVLSGVITGVIVKLEDAQWERAQDAETLFLSRQISTEHMWPQ